MNKTLEDIRLLVKSDTIQLTLSNKRSKDQKLQKVSIRKVDAEPIYFQIEEFSITQAFHKNVSYEEMLIYIDTSLKDDFKQIDGTNTTHAIFLKISKKEKWFLKEKKLESKLNTMPHNRKKQYLLEEGIYIPVMQELGIYTKDGMIVKSKYDKYKQINRFVELIDDAIDDKVKELKIIDFGCGKSYLTFILYYYLTHIRNIDTEMIGLDLKEDVIHKCNRLAKKYGYGHLHFEIGDINGYQAAFRPDVVISLHACDTASDYALFNAITWDATHIFCVPCCQHEFNQQMKDDNNPLFMDYGIVKEQIAALLTDAFRSKMLESKGYKVQMLEFIDISHSPKNILIRATKANISNQKVEKAIEQMEQLMKQYQIHPTLDKLFKQ